jgi:hypothetical protein
MTPEPEERLLLVLVGEDRPGAELPRQGFLTVGSSKERAGFHVEGERIEGLHCAIARTKGGGWAIKDLGSANGTLVNGRRVEAARLRAGDRIHVGSRELRNLAPASAAGARPDETGALEEGLALEEPSSAPAPASAPALSGYRVERPLGRGGMGSVYLAVQASLDRPVALKVLAGRLAADAEFVRRFQAEARAAAALAHPNVVTVYDVGEENGVHYLSMEYMDRGTLEERVGGGRRIPWKETLDVLRDAAAGLVYAESKGIVHRDLKPANLMQNHVGATKIADLGLATHLESEERQSAEKKVFGTPHFMAPEQARGEKVDGRSDLYSLGATAYRLLTGHTPFEGTNAREIVRAHLSLEPRPMRELAPELPDAALELVGRMMRKNPAERFASAAELLKEIDRLRAATAAPAVRPRSRSGAKVAALLLLLVLGGGAWWLHGHPDALDALERAAGLATLPPPGTVKPPVAASPAAPPGPGPAEPAGPETAAAGSTEEKPKDDDKSLQLLEANAKVALLELLGQEMTPEQKRDALRALASTWRGTTAATEAVDKAQAIDSDLSTRASADVEHQARVDEVVARLQAAAATEGENPPRPGQALLNMRAVPGQAALAGDPTFVARRREIEHGVVGRAAEYARARVEETTKQMGEGRFEGVEAKLTELLPVFELPDFPPGEGPAGIDDLFEIGRTARERLKNLELIHGQFVTRQVREDALALAQGLGGAAGLEHEIRTLDLAAAKQRLAALQSKVASKESRAVLDGMKSDVEAAQAVLATLGKEFASWRRKSFSEPHAGKNLTRNAVGADAEGILAEGSSGGVEHVPWSAFGGDDREISKLFTERLTREWNAEELRGIAGLLRMTAVVEVIGRTGKMFDPTKRYNFTEADAREVLECFAQAQAWADRSGTTAELSREIAAAKQLSLVCQKVTEGAWSYAVSAGEDLLARHGDSLLVRLLSDGTLPEAPKSKD